MFSPVDVLLFGNIKKIFILGKTLEFFHDIYVFTIYSKI